MPFKSKSQQRAAFSGALGAEMKAKAPEFAAATNQKKLPEKVGKAAPAKRAAVKPAKPSPIAKVAAKAAAVPAYKNGGMVKGKKGGY